MKNEKLKTGVLFVLVSMVLLGSVAFLSEKLRIDSNVKIAISR